MLTHSIVIKSESIGKGKSGGGIGGEDVYNGNREKPVLALLLDSYSKLKAISVSVSRPSCSTSYYLLTT